MGHLIRFHSYSYEGVKVGHEGESCGMIRIDRFISPTVLAMTNRLSGICHIYILSDLLGDPSCTVQLVLNIYLSYLRCPALKAGPLTYLLQLQVATMSLSSCCIKGFEWEGETSGSVGKLANNEVYITGDNPDVGVMIIHDVLGWTFPNVRLLADHYAREANATVYVPDFFGGETLPLDSILNGRWHEVDLPAFLKKNSREIREPEIFDCAKALRQKHAKVGAVGFCYGGWAVFRLGAKEHQPPLVDCITAGHPSLLTKEDIDEVAVPVQMLAPEIDPVYTAELKTHTFETVTKLGLPFDYQHFPGVEHGCFIRGDANKAGEREALTRGKNAAVNWLRQVLGTYDS